MTPEPAPIHDPAECDVCRCGSVVLWLQALARRAADPALRALAAAILAERGERP